MSYFYLLLPSRLGLPFAPIRSQTQNYGVEEGADYLFKLLVSPTKQYYRHHFPSPEQLNKTTYLADMFTHYNQALQTLIQQWHHQSSLITFGGDHSISYISLNAVLERYTKETIGVLFFDSHADLHTKETSPTGNFHGMWMRTFFEQFTDNTSKSPQITPSQVAYIGNLSLEKEEIAYMNNHQIMTLNAQDCKHDQKILELKNWLKSFTHLHITFDVDIFSQASFAATGTPNPNGFTYHQVAQIVQVLADVQIPSISLDIVEYNPQKETSKKERELIVKTYDSLFQLIPTT